MAKSKQYIKNKKIFFSARNIIIIFALLVFGMSILLTKIFKFSVNSVGYDTVDDVFYNPLMGYAPDASCEEEVGSNKLVYLGITWAELEPQKGEFDFKSIETKNNLEQWREEGKKVVLRFMCDIPDEKKHIDIPKWLYELTKDGDFYDCEYGKGYSPDYSNEEFIRYHTQAINEIAKHWGEDNFIAYVELGSIGHWGEWHVKYDEGIKKIPQSDITDKYIEPYIKGFKKAKMLMRRPFATVKKNNFGVYNDMTGSDVDTNEWLDWINFGGNYDQTKKKEKLVAVPKVWEKSPVGGEFTSSISFNDMLGNDFNSTMELIKKTHMTFIGPKCPLEDSQSNLQSASDEVLKNIGYRYGIKQATFKHRKFFNQANCTLYIENSGSAPIYFNWRMYAYIYDENNKIVDRQEIDVDLRTIAGGQTKSVTFNIDEKYLEDGIPKIGIGIENPENKKPEVYLNMDTESENYIYFL